MHNSIMQLLNKYISKKQNNIILDAGCGTGLLLQKMSSLGKTYGVDINSEAIKFCRRRKLHNVQQGSIGNLQFPKNFFDIVTSIDVLYHLQVRNDKEALKEFYRVLKSGGILLLKVPAYEWLKGRHDVVVHTNHRYTKKEVELILKKTGFVVKKLTYGNALLFPLLLIKRLTDRYLPLEDSSEVQRFPKVINQILVLIQAIETKVLLLFNLPFGFSIYAVAQKPNIKTY